MESDNASFQCPNCGAPLATKFRFTKLITCEYCDSSVLLDGAAAKVAGKQGVMADYPSLLQLQQNFRHESWTFQPVGRARFEYEHGFWDEWWVVSGDDGKWVSVDEGDFAIQQSVELEQTPDVADLELGQHIQLLDQQLYVTERGHAVCIGMQGELPELISIGDEYDYLHLSGTEARLYTLEIKQDQISCYEGFWLDPFEIKAL